MPSTPPPDAATGVDRRPGAVDAAHFAPARLRPDCAHDRAAADLLDALPRPRFGHFGVIDERLDLRLVTALADRHPAWAIVMAGPVVTIDPAGLPSRPNIHWLGLQPYARLPYLLARWDVCLMPFALNAATRQISPAKTLAYMAGDKPVVSTGLPDVIAMYGDAVAVADGPEAFVGACEEVCAERGDARVRRARAMRNLVCLSSWDRAADLVNRRMAAALAASRVPGTPNAPARHPGAVALPAGLPTCPPSPFTPSPRRSHPATSRPFSSSSANR